MLLNNFIYLTLNFTEEKKTSFNIILSLFLNVIDIQNPLFITPKNEKKNRFYLQQILSITNEASMLI